MKSIKSWSKAERPREKMIDKGRDSLSDSELIALLIGNGHKDKSAISLAQDLLSIANCNLEQNHCLIGHLR